MLFDKYLSLDKRIERDKKKLISSLKSSDIESLIIAMDNNDVISKNVLEKRNDGSHASGDTISWYAYQISGELNDSSVKNKLLDLLHKEDFTKYRKYILTCLSSLCANTNDYELYDFLITLLKETDDNEIISSIVSRFRKLKKPDTLNIDFLKNLLSNGNYQHRINALSALENAEHTELEDILIQEFKLSDLHTKEMICANLRTTGTKKSMDLLETEFKRTRSNSLKYQIENTIKKIIERENTTANNMYKT